MLPLDGSVFPENLEQLVKALEAGLRKLVRKSDGSPFVTATGDFPQLTTLCIDLSGSEIIADDKTPNPIGTGRRQTGICVNQFKLKAEPITYQGTPVEFELSSTDASFDYDLDASGAAVLVPLRASGKIHSRATHAALEKLFLDFAQAGAETFGAKITTCKLTLSQDSPRSLLVNVRVEAQKQVFFTASGTVVIQGRIDVSDDLVAKLSQLVCSGEGMIGTMAAPFIQLELKKHDGTELPLSALPLGEVKVQDVHVSIADGALDLEAAFGS